MEQAPAGFLPRVYYGLTRGDQTYRFTADAEFTVTISGVVGTAYQLYSTEETTNAYIPAIATKIDDNTIKIVVKGDYTQNATTFRVVNMDNGDATVLTLTNPLTIQDASALLDYPAADNKNKQITVIHALESNSNNVIYASLDYNLDNVYNWIAIGTYTDGKDGYSVYGVNGTNIAALVNNNIIKAGDYLIAAEGFTYSEVEFVIGAMVGVVRLNPFTVLPIGNIRGPQGETGATGQDGADGADGYTPYIQDNYWYINGVNTGVKAIGTDGTNGQNGQSFQMQSGLYSTPDNWGETGNVDGDGNPLLQLPTLPTTGITGKGYVVYDPLTTPLAPFYDLYFANDGDTTWTIIHPFSGIAGTNGQDGATPYISGGTWWINGVNTGVAATGPQGPAGPGVPSGGTAGQVLAKVDGTDYNTEWITPSAGGGSQLYQHFIKFQQTYGFSILSNNPNAMTITDVRNWLVNNEIDSESNGIFIGITGYGSASNNQYKPLYGYLYASGNQVKYHTMTYTFTTDGTSISISRGATNIQTISSITDKVIKIL